MNYKNNKSNIIRAIKDRHHPYDLMPGYYANTDRYNYLEQAILYHLSSNSDSFVIVKSVVRTRLGMPKKKFEDAWKSLKYKGHIKGKPIQGGWEWTFSEISNTEVIKELPPKEKFTVTTGRQSNSRQSKGSQLTSTKGNQYQ